MTLARLELCCPRCHEQLHEDGIRDPVLLCSGCGRSYPIIESIPDLRTFPDPYIDREADWAKGRLIAQRAQDTDFAGLLEYYYSITAVVPQEHARRYIRGLLAAPARAEAALQSWQNAVDGRNLPRGAFLEIGCGTGPLLLAATRSYARVVGIDIAFRWLVVGRKRLSEAGVDVPLICACAEAVPFAAETFQCVAADSTLEVVRSQRRTLREVNRVLTPGGHFFVATPNRFSLGPDPHFGIWGAGFLPKRWTDTLVRKQRAIPAKRELLWLRTLRARLREAGLELQRLFLPDIPPQQRAHFSVPMRRVIDLYSLLKELPVVRQALYLIGPLLYAVAQKPDAPGHGRRQAAEAAQALRA